MGRPLLFQINDFRREGNRFRNDNIVAKSMELSLNLSSFPQYCAFQELTPQPHYSRYIFPFFLFSFGHTKKTNRVKLTDANDLLVIE